MRARPSGVPRRLSAHWTVEPFGHAGNPPMRTFAHADRKYAATTPSWTQRTDHADASQRRVSPTPARPTLGSTNSATTRARWSWSTLPYDMLIVTHHRYPHAAR